MTFALFDIDSELARIPRVSLGVFPSPIEPLPALAEQLDRAGALVFVKRDDISSPIYGGNKVRTLELLFGHAQALGKTQVYATGAFGSNHALATALHAPRVGLTAGALLFPQPVSHAAFENLRALSVSSAKLRSLPHWSLLPLGMCVLRGLLVPEKSRPYVMLPGGATPRGALGYVSAALELGQQIAAGLLPVPTRIWVGVGSTCTSAGLLAGLALARHLGIGFGPSDRPIVTSVRVTPWPVTSRLRILNLAARTSRLVSELTRGRLPHFDRRELGVRFHVDGHFLGRGYGLPSAAGLAAEGIWAELGLPALDSTYSAKAAAGLVHALRAGDPGPHLFWSTKSSVPLPEHALTTEHAIPRRMRAWLHGATRALDMLEP